MNVFTKQIPVGTPPANGGDGLDLKRKLPNRPDVSKVKATLDEQIKQAKEIVKKQEERGCGCW